MSSLQFIRAHPEYKDLTIAPYDARFPNTKKSNQCWQYWLDWRLCELKRGEDFEACKTFQRWTKSICPNEWIDLFNEGLENKATPNRILNGFTKHRNS